MEQLSVTISPREQLKGPQLSRIGFGRAFGTFGELLQGVLPSNQNFLVTFPINKFSRATFIRKENHSLQVFPSNKVKTLKLAELLLNHYDLPLEGLLYIDSDIPEGKGLASSSADLVAAARAIKMGYDLDFTPRKLEELMGKIEPTDGVMHQGIVSYYHVEVRIKKFLGSLPKLIILGIDEGGEVDTINFNRNKIYFSSHEKQQYADLLYQLEEAVMRQHLTEIGIIATMSAKLNQKIKKNAHLNDLIKINQEINGLGVIAAHSGTCLGILLEKKNTAALRQVSLGLQKLNLLNKKVFLCETVSNLEHLAQKTY